MLERRMQIQALSLLKNWKSLGIFSSSGVNWLRFFCYWQEIDSNARRKRTTSSLWKTRRCQFTATRIDKLCNPTTRQFACRATTASPERQTWTLWLQKLEKWRQEKVLHHRSSKHVQSSHSKVHHLQKTSQGTPRPANGLIPSLRVAAGFPPFSNTAIDMFGSLHVKGATSRYFESFLRWPKLWLKCWET